MCKVVGRADNSSPQRDEVDLSFKLTHWVEYVSGSLCECVCVYVSMQVGRYIHTRVMAEFQMLYIIRTYTFEKEEERLIWICFFETDWLTVARNGRGASIFFYDPWSEECLQGISLNCAFVQNSSPLHSSVLSLQNTACTHYYTSDRPRSLCVYKRPYISHFELVKPVI